MALGVGFRVAKGVRLRVTPRGPRLSLGPRIARVHVGGGRTAVSSGHGPVTVWSTLSGGGRRTSAAGGSSVVPRGEAKQRAWDAARERLGTLLTAHEEVFELAHRPVVPAPAPVEREVVRRELRRQARAGLAWWRLSQRWRAGRDADERLEAEVAARDAAQRTVHAAEQASADAWWERLRDNDPEVVTERLDEAFEDNPVPAAVTEVDAAVVNLVVLVEPAERLVGEREPTLTEAGNLSLAKMTKTRREELYHAAVWSSVVAAAAEAFAVAPGLGSATVAAVRPDDRAVLALAALPREVVLPDGARATDLERLGTAIDAGVAELEERRGGRTDGLQPLDPADPDVAEVLAVLEVADAEPGQ